MVAVIHTAGTLHMSYGQATESNGFRARVCAWRRAVRHSVERSLVQMLPVQHTYAALDTQV